MADVKLRCFNMQEIEERRLEGVSFPTIVIVGPRGSGKSTLIRDILFHIKKIPTMIVISASEESNGYYQQYIHPLMIHSEYKDEILENVMKLQKSKMKILKMGGEDAKNHPEVGIGLLLDDCGYNKTIYNKQIIREIFMNGRHQKIFFIVALQYARAIPPELRINVDYLFVFKTNNVEDRKRLYEFFGCIPKKTFNEIFDKYTQDNRCLVLKNTIQSSRIEKCIFYYKAEFDRTFKIGDKKLWNHLDKKYDPNYDEFDRSTLGEKKIFTNNKQ
jgi:hypothetical protein